MVRTTLAAAAVFAFAPAANPGEAATLTVTGTVPVRCTAVMAALAIRDAAADVAVAVDCNTAALLTITVRAGRSIGEERTRIPAARLQTLTVHVPLTAAANGDAAGATPAAKVTISAL